MLFPSNHTSCVSQADTVPSNMKVKRSGFNIMHQVTQSCLTLCDHGLYSPWNSPGQNTGVSSLFCLQGILPTQGSNPGLPHCRQILYQLSHQGSPTIPEWVAYPFSSRSPWPRNWTGVSCIAGGFFINWAIKTNMHLFLKVWMCSVGATKLDSNFNNFSYFHWL